jgi:hypothetical protein
MTQPPLPPTSPQEPTETAYLEKARAILESNDELAASALKADIDAFFERLQSRPAKRREP